MLEHDDEFDSLRSGSPAPSTPVRAAPATPRVVRTPSRLDDDNDLARHERILASASAFQPEFSGEDDFLMSTGSTVGLLDEDSESVRLHSSSSDAHSGAHSRSAASASSSSSSSSSSALWSNWQLFLLAMFWLGQATSQSAVLLILAPKQVLDLGYEKSKATILGLAVSLSAALGIFAYVLVGDSSDRAYEMQYRGWGRRRPYMIVGAIIFSFSLFTLGISFVLPLLFLGLLLFQLGAAFAAGPFFALIPDIVPVAQYGKAGGWVGMMILGGNVGGALSGFIVGSLGVFFTYFLLILIVLGTMVVTITHTRESRRPADPSSFEAHIRSLKRWDLSQFEIKRIESLPLHKRIWFGKLKPFLSRMLHTFTEPFFTSRDFLWMWVMRFSMSTGLFMVQEYLQFFILDVVSTHNPTVTHADGSTTRPYVLFGFLSLTSAEAATGLALLTLLLFSVLAAYGAGILSDRWGRKNVVYLGVALQLAALCIMLILPLWSLIVLACAVFGLGYGCFQTVDYVIAADVMIPSPHTRARDMGIWHASIGIPLAVVTPLAGVLLDLIERLGAAMGAERFFLGYRMLLFIAGLFMALSAFFVTKIRFAAAQPPPTTYALETQEWEPAPDDD